MASGKTTAITNVRVFDGTKLTDPTTVYISDGKIVSHGDDVTEIDGRGFTLLPGLIDAHCHVFHHDELVQLAKSGVTTALDMGSFPVEKVHSFRKQKGLTDYYSAGIGLTAPGTRHSKLAGMPTEAQVTTADGGRQFVRDRLNEGMGYIKLIVDSPGPSQEVLDAACKEAKKVGKLSIAHATSFQTVDMAQAAGCDFITHVPMDRPVTDAGVQKMVEEGRGCIPTLTIMEVVHNLGSPGINYKNCEQSVRMIHQAGVTILAGTDSNAIPGSPAHVPHGKSIVRELELLVQAGLSTVEALRAATIDTAKAFGFKDRRAIEPGMRADLLLVEGDPIADITAVKNVKRVWCGGIEVLRPISSARLLRHETPKSFTCWPAIIDSSSNIDSSNTNNSTSAGFNKSGATSYPEDYATLSIEDKAIWQHLYDNIKIIAVDHCPTHRKSTFCSCAAALGSKTPYVLHRAKVDFFICMWDQHLLLPDSGAHDYDGTQPSHHVFQAKNNMPPKRFARDFVQLEKNKIMCTPKGKLQDLVKARVEFWVMRTRMWTAEYGEVFEEVIEMWMPEVYDMSNETEMTFKRLGDLLSARPGDFLRLHQVHIGPPGHQCSVMRTSISQRRMHKASPKDLLDSESKSILPDSRIKAKVSNISVGSSDKPIQGTGMLIGCTPGGGEISCFLETGTIHSNSGLPPGTADRISGGVFVVQGTFADEVRNIGSVSTYGTNDMVLDNWGVVEQWTALADCTSYGPSSIGFVQLGQIGTLSIEGVLTTHGAGSCGFNAGEVKQASDVSSSKGPEAGEVREAIFERIVTHGDGAIGVQVSVPEGRIVVKNGIETLGGVGSSLARGVVMKLAAAALNIKPGGAAEEIYIENGLITHGRDVQPLELLGRVGTLHISGNVGMVL